MPLSSFTLTILCSVRYTMSSSFPSMYSTLLLSSSTTADSLSYFLSMLWIVGFDSQFSVMIFGCWLYAEQAISVIRDTIMHRFILGFFIFLIRLGFLYIGGAILPTPCSILQTD